MLDGLPDMITLSEAQVNAGPVAVIAGRTVISDLDSTDFDGGRLEIGRPTFSNVSDQFSAPDNQAQDNFDFASARVSI